MHFQKCSSSCKSQCYFFRINQVLTNLWYTSRPVLNQMLLFHHFSQPIREKSFELRFTHRSIGNYTIFLIILYYFFMLVRNKDSIPNWSCCSRRSKSGCETIKSKWCFVACLIWSIKSYLLNKHSIITIHLLQYIRKCCNSSRLFYFLSNHAL